MYCIYIEARELARKLKRYETLNSIVQNTGIFYKYLILNFSKTNSNRPYGFVMEFL